MFSGIGDILRSFKGDFETVEGETLGLRLRDVDLSGGVLYGRRSVKHLRRRPWHQLAFVRARESLDGVLYESWLGNRWFASWLAEDCLTYRLAEAHGRPVTSRVTTGGHMPEYEALLGMKPHRTAYAHFRELILFKDMTNNAGRSARAADLRRRVLAGRAPPSHPGVFIMRGTTGDRRLLRNELVMAEDLARRRGFRILDPAAASVAQIAEDCGGAEVVAGIEGSHLTHGIMLMPPGATLLVLQPPERVVSHLKIFTDRQDQRYALVIGSGGAAEFEVDSGEVHRTLDLL